MYAQFKGLAYLHWIRGSNVNYLVEEAIIRFTPTRTSGAGAAENEPGVDIRNRPPDTRILHALQRTRDGPGAGGADRPGRALLVHGVPARQRDGADTKVWAPTPE